MDGDDLSPDPRCDEPSPVPGLTQLEYDEYAANIRWFSRFSPGEVLAETRKFARRARWFASLSVRGR